MTKDKTITELLAELGVSHEASGGGRHYLRSEHGPLGTAHAHEAANLVAHIKALIAAPEPTA